MILAENLFEGARSHPYREWQAGSVSVAQAAAGHSHWTADSTAEEILTHRQRSYGYWPNTGSRAAVLRRSEGTRFSSPSDDEVGGDKARSARSEQKRAEQLSRRHDAHHE
jgi:hypothetical protein